jgi:uncharacterized protein
MTAAPVDHIRYDLMVRDALRGVVRRVLADVARNGLPGDHHFFVSFDTQAAGVKISPRLMSQYPKEMTIVLQHQFWDLNVTETGLEVGLSFGGVPERLVVPFEAIRGFFDPSVQFGLEFAEQAEGAASSPDSVPTIKSGQLAPVASAGQDAKPRRLSRGKPSAASSTEPPPLAAVPPPQPPEPDTDPDRPSGGAEVVRLDRFRKK